MTKIAIIEDDPTISQMYRLKFEAEGYDVQLASDGNQGVELVKTYNPDVILLDLQMPHKNGDEALAEIRQLDDAKNTPVIILTNLGKEEAPKSLAELNVHSYVVKASVTPSQVVEKVKVALG